MTFLLFPPTRPNAVPHPFPSVREMNKAAQPSPSMSDLPPSRLTRRTELVAAGSWTSTSVQSRWRGTVVYSLGVCTARPQPDELTYASSLSMWTRTWSGLRGEDNFTSDTVIAEE